MSIPIKNDKIVHKSITPIKRKTKKQRDKERKIVLKWALNNISQGESNYYYKSVDIYDKFIKATKLNLTITSFGGYLKNILKILDINYINTKKDATNDPRYSHRRKRGVGQCNYYFGLDIKNLKYNKQYFDLTSFKTNHEDNGQKYKIFQLKFNYFTDEKLLNWSLANIIIDRNYQISQLEIFNSYCKYYNFNIEPITIHLRNFSKIFNLFLKKNYPFVKKTRIINLNNKGLKTTSVKYSNLKLKI